MANSVIDPLVGVTPEELALLRKVNADAPTRKRRLALLIVDLIPGPRVKQLLKTQK